MLLAPAQRNGRRSQSSTVKVVPPPIGGWNARDDITAMSSSDAVSLENVIPGDTGAVIRSGYSAHVTGLGDPIQSLMEYAKQDGTSKLFAATESDIYDVTTAGAVGSASVTTLTSGWWQHTMFATSGGLFLVIANGADSVRNYDGSSWSTPAITNVTSSTLITVTAHASRLYFVQKDTMKIWYLPNLSIAGAATSVDFGGLSRLGGYLVNMASWTRDGGTGMEDFAVFVTSKGEVHIYQGYDPTSWSRVGTFVIPEPIGRRCFIKLGGDLGILTSQGLVPLSGVLDKALSAQARVAATDKIRNAFTEAYRVSGTAKGWHSLEYPKQKLLLINVPNQTTDAAGAQQYVMNANTGAWCKFTGIDANVWALMGDALYFGGVNGTVYAYGGQTDAGGAISGVCQHAFSTFGTPRTKHFKRCLPLYVGSLSQHPRVAVRLDYGSAEQLPQAMTISGSSGSEWDPPSWDEWEWGGDVAVNVNWIAIQGGGYAGSFMVELRGEDGAVYSGAKLVMEVGDNL